MYLKYKLFLAIAKGIYMNGDHPNNNKVISLLTRMPWQESCDDKLIRLSPELDGLEILYSNDSNPNLVFNMKILCWGLNKKGEVVALVPWLDKLQSCQILTDPLNGTWRGYRNPVNGKVFFDAPQHKFNELRCAVRYFAPIPRHDSIIQEIPDNIGTHAIFSKDNLQTFEVKQIISWRLMTSGTILAMIANHNEVTQTPILPGDTCLYPAQSHTEFKYFFHHSIANQLKKGDKKAIHAFSGFMN